MKSKLLYIVVAVVLLFIGIRSIWAQFPDDLMDEGTKSSVPEGCKVERDIVYASVGGKDLTLDVCAPEKTTGKLPVIVWVHGGAWQAGSKDRAPAASLATRGYAVVSINYRLSNEATFPAQIFDCKAAIRWVRANAAKYNFDADHIGAAGASAGGHLVALLGTSGGVKELEGNEGHARFSSRVQAVVDFFGPTDFLKMGGSHDGPDSPESKLIGGPIQGNKEKVERANPITYIGPGAPPFLIVHGDEDETVPISQSLLLTEALKKAGVDVTFEVAKGKSHGFNDPRYAGIAAEFFDKHLKAAAPRSEFSFVTEAAAETITPIDAKAPPTGIFALLEGDRIERPLRDLAGRAAWRNPNVAGLTLRTAWNKVEPAPLEWNWMLFDEGLELARKHDKRIGLSLIAGAQTPEWVFREGAKRFEFTMKTNFKADFQAHMPLPWDEAFLDKWAQVLNAMGKRYDGDPHVAYVMVGGLGAAMESYFAKRPEDASALQRVGGVRKWVEGAKKVIDLHAAAFARTPFIMAMAPPVPGPAGESALREVVEYGVNKYPGRFGVMHHGLNAKSSSKYLPNRLVSGLSDKTTVGFQMVWSTQGQNAPRIRGSLRDALDRAQELRAHFVEVYAVDCDNPTYAGDLREASAGLARNRR